MYYYIQHVHALCIYLLGSLTSVLSHSCYLAVDASGLPVVSRCKAQFLKFGILLTLSTSLNFTYLKPFKAQCHRVVTL